MTTMIEPKEGHELIIYRLDELKADVSEIKAMQTADNTNIFARLGKVEIAISALKVKSGVWGVIGGAVPVALTIILYLIFK